jgi:hypothetical protein
MNRRVTNRLQRSAGPPGGAHLAAPPPGPRVGPGLRDADGPVAYEDGFVIALPYGADTDWLRNLVAAGSAELVRDGKTYAVDRPEVVATAEVAEAFPPNELRTHRIFGVTQALRIHATELSPT